MDKEKKISSQSANARGNRIKRIKTCIIIIGLVFLILPTILCTFMFIKLNYLQKQINILMIDRYGVTYSSKNLTSNEIVAHAATVYNSGFNTDSGQIGIQSEDNKNNTDKSPSLEENTKDEYYNNEFQADKDNVKDNPDTAKNLDTRKDSKPVKDTLIKSDSDKDEYKDFNKKTVYLTFDDGPSKYTGDILKILSDYNVKATFFVIGKTDEHSKKMYKEIVKDGHTLGMHSYSHDYNIIYKSVKDFDKDFTKLRDLLYDTTGYIPSIYRFPGGSGSSNVMKADVSVFINFLNQKSVVYFDWNVVSGDATGVDYTPEQLYDNVIDGIKLHNRSIVLMHDTDTKENTVKSLKQVLETLTEQGVELLPLNENVIPIQQVKADSLEQIK
ncbi:MAG: polysaccharide deacetylase family protein [Anaerocolumna sp.]